MLWPRGEPQSYAYQSGETKEFRIKPPRFAVEEDHRGENRTCEECMNRERGFILVEIVAILLIVGIIVNVWLPSYMSIKKKAQAARIIGDYLVIRDAVTMFHSEYGRWPMGSSWGRAPAGVGQFMPPKFSWDLRPEMDIRYSWEYLPVAGSAGRFENGITGLSVFSEDDALIRAITNIFRGRMVIARGFEDSNRVILIVHMTGKDTNG
jgi:type II secretory pathway pseudopilin PulG